MMTGFARVPWLAEVALRTIPRRTQWPAKLRAALPSRRIELVGPKLLSELADLHPSATFVDIGAHDGIRGNCLSPFILSRPWKGVMVEPVPHLFERLRRNYGALERVALENVAIDDVDGRRPFYHLAPVDDPEREGLPVWYDEIGSLSRDEVVGHRRLIPDVERHLVCTEVRCLTFESLCRRHDLGELDILLIDAEGHDWVILQGVDFAAHRPRLVVYEHLHLPPRDRAECRAYLERQGYETREERFDTWCLHPRAGKRMRRKWRRLRWPIGGISVHEPA
jgi:FkbM family methyltransferase